MEAFYEATDEDKIKYAQAQIDYWLTIREYVGAKMVAMTEAEKTARQRAIEALVVPAL